MSADREDGVHLVHLESSGNQAFIFGTNKLKENVGASEMTYLAGTESVARAVNRVYGLTGQERMPERAADPERVAEWLLAQPAIEDAVAGRTVEVLLATSGKALILVRGEARARELVHTWSTELAVNLPGVDGLGVISRPFELGSGGEGSSATAAAVRETHRRFDAARALRPSLEARFSRAPLTAACEVSGLPAEHLLRREGGPPEQLSHTSGRKRRHVAGAGLRFAALFEEDEKIVKNLDILLDLWPFDWLGVVHADGNGLGELFLRFESIARDVRQGGEDLDRAYVNTYRAFSLALDQVAREVFKEVTGEIFADLGKPLPEREREVYLLPILPIVVGGDDLTILCDGRRALPFVRRYLEVLETRLMNLDDSDVLARVLCRHFGVPRFGMAAGVALVKPKFPFFSAYSVAEELTRSAKAVKQRVRRNGQALPASALDFHLTFESSVLDLATARERLVATENEERYRLHGRPYVTTSVQRLENEGVLDEDAAWARAHAFEAFGAARRALAQSTDGGSRRAFPTSQAHRVRTALRRSPGQVEETFAHLRTRYEAHGFAWPDDCLWVSSPADPEAAKFTRFQDALETLDLFEEHRSASELSAESGEEVRS